MTTMKKLVVNGLWLAFGWLVAAGLCGTAWAGAAAGPVEYFDWNESTSNLVSKTCTDYTVLDETTAADLGYTLSNGWYVVTGRVELIRRKLGNNHRCGLDVQGKAHLILMDDVADLTTTNDFLTTSGAGIRVKGASNALTIYGQAKNTGRLTAVGDAWSAAIGTEDIIYSGSKDGGAITINGGTVTVMGTDYSPGIGCYDGYSGYSITINGGIVHADIYALYGGFYQAPAIGCVENCQDIRITINGGEVSAISGIGCGSGSREVAVTINGGDVTAIACEDRAGIGDSNESDIDITINGGKVTATGAAHVAAIGGDFRSTGTVTINGGEVSAFGDDFLSPGIGNSDTGFSIYINGGDITAVGSSFYDDYYYDLGPCAGIGGYFLMTGGNLTVIGGGDASNGTSAIGGTYAKVSGGTLLARSCRRSCPAVGTGICAVDGIRIMHSSGTTNTLSAIVWDEERRYNEPWPFTLMERSPIIYIGETARLTIPLSEKYTPVVQYSDFRVSLDNGVCECIPGSEVSVFFVPEKDWTLAPSAVSPVTVTVDSDKTLSDDLIPAFVAGKPPIPYLEWNDVLCVLEGKTCTDYEELFLQDWLEDGKWYVVKGNRPIHPYQLSVSGAAHLILCDGSELTVEAEDQWKAAIRVQEGNSLSIYGQTNQTGRLTAKYYQDNSTAAGIGGNYNEDGGTVTIHGGDITAIGADGPGIGGGDWADHGCAVAIHGGQVKAIGSVGIGNRSSRYSDSLAINGGEVTMTGNSTCIGDQSVRFGSRTTATVLAGPNAEDAHETAPEDIAGWRTNKYAHITAVAEPIPPGHEVNPWLVLDADGNPTGWIAHTNGYKQVIFTGEGTLPTGFGERAPFDEVLLNTPQIFVPTGKLTLFKEALPNYRDKIFEPLEYVVWDETENRTDVRIAPYYVPVTPDTDTLGSGWHVVDGAVTNRTGGIRVEGDAHLILLTDAEFAVTGGAGRPGIELTADGSVTNSLAVHGLAGSTGRLTAIGGEGADGIGTGASGTAEPGVFTMDCQYRWVYAGMNADGTGAVRVRPEGLAIWHTNRFVQIRNGSVTYLDWDGGKMTNAHVTTYSVLNAKTSVLTSGWYVVEGAVTNATGGITVTGDAHLILADDAKFVANGIQVDGSRRLTIYGQANGTGRLATTGGRHQAGIGGGYMGNCGTVTINGGSVTAKGGQYAAGIGGGYSGAGGNVTINGGEVTAIGSEGADGIGRGYNTFGNIGTLTLNRPSARIRVGEDASGAETTEVLLTGFGNWHGNRYVHIAPEDVEYAVWNEATGTLSVQTCSVYQVVLPSISVFTSGWYVVSVGITNNTAGGLWVDGDVNLILCDGVNFQVKCTSGRPGIELTADGSVTNSLAVHGQVGGTGVLTAIGRYGADGIGLSVSSEAKPGVLTVDGLYMRAYAGVNEDGAGAVRVRPEDLAIWHTNSFAQIKQRPMPYLDWDGGTMTNAQVTMYSVLDPETSVLKDGWYVVDGAVTNATGGITVTGDAHLILADDAELVANGIQVDGAGQLTFYGQEKGTGWLTTTGGAGVAGIGTSGQVTVNGGIIAATGGAGAAGIGGGNHGNGGTVTVHGGEVTAIGGEGADGIGAGAGSGNFGAFGLDYPNGIIFAGMDPSGTGAVVVKKDAFPTWHVNRYVHIQWAAPGGEHNPWPVLDGSGDPTEWAAYTNGNGVVFFIGSGLLPAGFAEMEPFCTVLPNAPKIFVPGEYLEQFREALPSCLNKIFGSVEYFGWDETETRLVAATCSVYTVVTPETETLVSGWYVVNSAVTNRMGRISVDGDAHLILVDDAELVVDGISVGCHALTIYGQARNTGVLTVIGGGNSAGISGPGMHVTINGGIIVATGGENGAGIGGGNGGDGGMVTVHGGDVTAIGGEGADGIGASWREGSPGSFEMHYPEATIYVGMTPDAVEAVAKAEEFSVWHTNRHVHITTTDLIAKGSERNPWTVGEADHEDELLAYTNGVGQLTVIGTGLPKSFNAGEEPWADVEPEVEIVFVPRDQGAVFRAAWPGMADRIYDGRESTGYYAWDGSAVTGPLVVDALTVIPEMATLTSGWYVVKGAVTNATGGITVSGDVHLILADGAEFVVVAENDRPAVELVTDETGARSLLAVYGQAEGTGRILADANAKAKIGYAAGIGGGENDPFNGRLDVHGGQIEARGGDYAAGVGGGRFGYSRLPNEDWLEGFDVNVFGGRVLAVGGYSGVGAGADSEYPRCAVTVLGGEVLANGGAGAIGWNCSIELGDRLMLWAGDENELGDFSGLGVMPLEKYLETPRMFARIGPAVLVEYLDWDETESRFVAATCTVYTSVMPNMNFLESGWYVVDRTVTNMTDGIRVDGDVHLILVDGAKLVAPGKWSNAGVCVRSDYGGTSSLVIYGQAGGTGALEATGGEEGGAGIGGSVGGSSGVITINGGIVTATGDGGGAGIGGGREGIGGTVTVRGGSVTAIGGENADGIGGGAADYFRMFPGTFTMENPNAHIFVGMNVDGTEVEEVVPEDFCDWENQSGWHANRYVQISTKMMPTVKIVSAKSVRSEGLWNGTAEVVNELSGLDDAKSYALAFELAAAGRFGAVTNNLGAQTEGVCTNLIGSMELFGALVQDPAAVLTLKLIEIDSQMQVSAAVKEFPFGNYVRLTVPGVRHAWYELCTNGVPVASERLSDDTFILPADAVPVTVVYTPTPGYLFASGDDSWTKTYSADDLKNDEVTLPKDEVVAGIGDIVTGPVEYFIWSESEERLVAETCSVYMVVTPETATLGNGWYVVNEEVLNTTGGIVVDGDAHLILLDKVAHLAVTGASCQAGIEVTVVEGVTNSLTVYGQRNGTGRIEAGPSPNDRYAAAIGGSMGNPNCGQVRIDGGSVAVESCGYGAGIGGGFEGAGGTVTINGGRVAVRMGGSSGAGIGNGAMTAGGADVTINGGEVTVTAVDDEIMSAGIGDGAMATGGADITINGGTVDVDLRYDNEGGNAAAIGGGLYGSACVAITINGGAVKAFSDLGAGIGNAALGAYGAVVTINGGTVLAGGACFYWDSVCGGAGIGGGAAAPGADVLITGGEVTAIAYPAYNDDDDCFIWSSGIGAGYCPEELKDELADIYTMGTFAMNYPGAYVYSGMDTNGIEVAEINDAAATYGSLQNPGWCTNCYVKITPYILGSERNPWQVPDENGDPTGWSAYTNGTDDVIFTGEGPLPDGFAAKPPFSDVLPKAPTIHVPTGTKEQFTENMPEYGDKITDGSAPAEVKIVSAKSARTEGVWSGAAQVVYSLKNLDTAKTYDLAVEMLADGQFAAKTNPVVNIADGVYTQEVSRTVFFGIESQVQDPTAELTLKLIEK